MEVPFFRAGNANSFMAAGEAAKANGTRVYIVSGATGGFDVLRTASLMGNAKAKFFNEKGDNLCFCDTMGALGGAHLLSHPHVRCMQVSTGRTRQAFDRLSEKVLANIEAYNR